jgi:hypothetical protein
MAFKKNSLHLYTKKKAHIDKEKYNNFLVSTIWFTGEGSFGNTEFGCVVNKVWLRIVCTYNQTRALLNN